MKFFKFGTKNALFGSEIFKKNIVKFEINALEYFLIAKFCAKTKILTFGTKNALFGCFWQ